MMANPFEALRLVNQNLSTALSRLRSWSNPRGGHSYDFSLLHGEVLRSAEVIREISSNATPEPELAKEISQYRRNLAALAEILPVLHGGMLAQRSRLQAALNRLQTAAAWAEAGKSSL